jgi:hypothetical protein
LFAVALLDRFLLVGTIRLISKRAASLHRGFPKVFPRSTEEEDRLFKLLSDAYIDARYKKTHRITEEELERLGRCVRKLRDATERICKEMIESLKS